MTVVWQCTRVRASPAESVMCKNRLFTRICVLLWTPSDWRFLTRNEQVSGSSPLVGSSFTCVLLASDAEAREDT
jgi:hypothetical protein